MPVRVPSAVRPPWGIQLALKQTIPHTQKRPSDREAQETIGYLQTSQQAEGYSQAPTVSNKDIIPTQNEHRFIGHLLKGSNNNQKQYYGGFSLPSKNISDNSNIDEHTEPHKSVTIPQLRV